MNTFYTRGETSKQFTSCVIFLKKIVFRMLRYGSVNRLFVLRSWISLWILLNRGYLNTLFNCRFYTVSNDIQYIINVKDLEEGGRGLFQRILLRKSLGEIEQKHNGR